MFNLVVMCVPAHPERSKERVLSTLSTQTGRYRAGVRRASVLKDRTLTVAGAAQARGSVWIALPVSRLTFPMRGFACGKTVFAPKAPILISLYHGIPFVKLKGYLIA
jgi:hypothetical protein